MSKGSSRRRPQVSDAELRRNWDAAFKDSPKKADQLIVGKNANKSSEKKAEKITK